MARGQRVVVIGGGVVGSSVAYHLAAHPRFDGTVTVVERDPSFARASSSLSASGIRQQFSTPLCVAMSQYGVAFLRAAADTLAVDADRPAMALREAGYLFLADAAGEAELRTRHAMQRAAGADIVLLDGPGLRARFPWLATDRVALGSLGLSGEGWFDGPALHAALRRKARSLGVVYRPAEATGFSRRGERITGVAVGDATLPCDVAVDAAGPWSARIASWVGIALPVHARKRDVHVLACREALPGCPLVITPSGVYFRPEGDRFLAGRCPTPDEPDPEEPALAVDEHRFARAVWPALAEAAPALEAVKVVGGWSGYYEVNLFDHNGLIGPHPACPNLVFATGFSGHGMQHAPATGRGVAEWIADGVYTSLDLSALGTDRLAKGRRVTEQAVV